MSDRPQYPSYPGGDGEPASGQVPPGYGNPPPPQQPPPYGYAPQDPPPAGYPAQGYSPQPYAQQGYGYRPQPVSNGLAITSMVLGILSILSCWLGIVLGILAIVFSVVSRKQISAQPAGTMTGAGMATAGLVTGILGTLIWSGLLVLMISDATSTW